MADKKEIKRYKCSNYGACKKADNNEIIEFDAIETLGGIPDCPGCQQHTLEEIIEKTIPWKLIAGIIGAVLVLGGIGFGIYKFIGSSKPTVIKLDKTELTLTVGEKDLIVPTAEPEGINATFTYKVTDGASSVSVSSGGEITALKAGKAVVFVECEENKELNTECKITVKEQEIVEDPDSVHGGDAKEGSNSTGDVSNTGNPKGEGHQNGTSRGTSTTTTYDLGWGKYEGPMHGGKPNGFGGTIIVRSSYSIDLKKASGETVQVEPGDKIMSVKMENGRLRQGEIHFANGTRKYISGL